MLEPSDLVAKLEQKFRQTGAKERGFAGFGVMGLPFTSGHALGMRRFPESCLGPEYTSVWHRNPAGQWRMFQNIAPENGLARYYGNGVSEARVRRIYITWTSQLDFRVLVDDENPIHWTVALAPAPETRFMHALGGTTPSSLWRQPDYLKMMGGISSLALGAGYLGLEEHGADSQRFAANPRLVWSVAYSSANTDGQDLGDVGSLPFQPGSRNFWLPQQGFFVVGSAFLEEGSHTGTFFQDGSNDLLA